MATIAPGRLHDVSNAADFVALTETNFEILTAEVFKQEPTYVSGASTAAVAPPATGSHVLNEIWKDTLGGVFKCTTAGTPGTWRQILPVAATADPATGTIPTGYLILNVSQGTLKRHAGGYSWDPDLHPMILSSLTRLLLPLALLASIFIFLRGHNLPGGGFVAGLITAVALIMQYLANGVAWTQTRLPWNLRLLIGLGLLIATFTGLASLAFSFPFLTSTFGHLHWPVVGEFELASAMAFDLGVYLVVVGATLLILIHLGRMHRTRRSPDPSELLKENG